MDIAEWSYGYEMTAEKFWENVWKKTDLKDVINALKNVFLGRSECSLRAKRKNKEKQLWCMKKAS